MFGHWPPDTTRPALFTALRAGFADELLRQAFTVTRDLRTRRRRERGLALGADARGLGKLLIVAPDQANARRYAALLRGWVPKDQTATVQLATADEPDAHGTLARFRLCPEPGVLVTVAMAYEGLDAPEVAVAAALTHIRSRAWLEQMVARATRVDPHAGPYGEERALVFHPDDPLFARFRHSIETEQGMLAKPVHKLPHPRATRLASGEVGRTRARGRHRAKGTSNHNLRRPNVSSGLSGNDISNSIPLYRYVKGGCDEHFEDRRAIRHRRNAFLSMISLAAPLRPEFTLAAHLSTAVTVDKHARHHPSQSCPPASPASHDTPQPGPHDRPCGNARRDRATSRRQ